MEARWVSPNENNYHYVFSITGNRLFWKTKPHRFVIHLSVDNRYRLFVNGTYVTDGPQISNARHWRFDAYTLN